ALAVLHDLNVSKRRKLPDQAPTAFVPPRWEKLVFTADGVDRRYYELCALSELRNALRAGDVWVAGSRHYQDFESYLLSPTAWQEWRRAEPWPLAAPRDFWRYLEERKTELQRQLGQVNERIGTAALPGVRLTKGVLHITPPPKTEPAGMEEV